MSELKTIKRALLSVSDKAGLLELAKELNKFGIEIISTGGTAKTLRDGGLNVTEVSEVTGFPDSNNGILVRNRRYRVVDIPDGTSNTIMVIERESQRSPMTTCSSTVLLDGGCFLPTGGDSFVKKTLQ